MELAIDLGNVIVEVDFDKFFKEFKKVSETDPLNFLYDIQHSQDLGERLTSLLRWRLRLGEEEIGALIGAWNSAIKPNDEVTQFLNIVIGEGVEVGILSNIGYEHEEHIWREHAGIFRGKVLHLSNEVGSRKPTKLYYQSFLLEHPTFRGSLYIDDRRENLEMAERFGFRGYYFNLEEFKRMGKARRIRELGNIHKLIRNGDTI